MSDNKIPDDILWHQSGVNAKGEPFVQLLRGTAIVGQMSTTEARDHAQAMLEAAEAAETDAFILKWVREHVGAGDEQAVGLLADFRRYRSMITGKREGPQRSGDWVMPE